MPPSFAERNRKTAPQQAWAAKKIVPAVNARERSEPNTVQPSTSPPAATPWLNLHLSLNSSPSLPLTAVQAENPLPLLQCPPTSGARSACSPEAMAYQRADPRPFIPATFQWVDVPNREFMCRAVAPTRPPANNEDLAIVTFEPLPGNELNFFGVRNIIREFLDGRNVHYRAVLPCHLGQAYDRDNLVSQSPWPSETFRSPLLSTMRVGTGEECFSMKNVGL